MEFTALWKMDKKQISDERGQEKICHLSPPGVLFLLPFLLPCISIGSVTLLPPSPTQKWRSTFWFSCNTYSSLPELLFHYGVIKNLASPFHDTCQVSNCRHSGLRNRKVAHIKCSTKPRMIHKRCHYCSQFPSFTDQTYKKFEMGSDKHGPWTFNEHGGHGI